ncbi:putative F-box protein [Raphanus sativus]|uniref:F-box protein At3g16210 n=1 Tax=Raphanus sativus TaxID=3726 RepID=A0A6J0NUW6_RAPSA|nr:putative F-box protein At3g16210 [Raphanus sativus]KAJ4893760.1 putative F-box protein [Raphanus sativus]
MSEYLSEELAFEILARLTIKDLARFRCVCKTWRDIINSRGFSERYRDVSSVKFVSFYDKGFYLLDVEDKLPLIETPRKLDFPLDHQSMIDESTCVLHCDGTLCVTLKNHTLLVWNPSSKRFRIVPNPGIYRDSNILGFGYDPVSNDYNIVMFMDKPDTSTAQVFEFKTGSWRDSVRIPCPDWYYRERRGTFLDQYLYWIAYRSDVDRFILCFNLSTNEYRKLSLPVYDQGATCSWLGVTSRKLCITEYGPCEEIWISVMDKTESWNKIISLSISNLISIQDNIFDYQVEFVSFTKRNDIVVTYTGYYDNVEMEGEKRVKKKVFLYKTGDNTFQEIRFCNSFAGFRLLGEYVVTSLIIDRYLFETKKM